jgi:hypothetical protein
MRTTHTIRAVAGLLLLVIGILVWRLIPPDQDVAWKPLPECPEGGDWSKVFAPDGAQPPFGVLPGGQVTLAGETTEIVEFHDCQQFIVTDDAPGTLRYTSLVAIFARKNLDSSYRQPVHLPTPYDSLTMGTPMATILAFDSAYAPLGIEGGFNCLYFFRNQGGEVPGYQARVVPVGLNEAECANPLKPKDTRGTTLAVREDESRDQPPPVARWDWDNTNKQQYIGIRCGNAWCEAHTSSYETGKSFASSEPLNRLQKRSKGWYDEQLLTVAVNGTSNTPQVSTIVGTLIPASDLGRWSGQPETSAFRNVWQPVATIAISGNPGGYTSKLNLIESGEDIALNQVWLCFPDTATQGQCPDMNSSAPSCGPGEWYAKIVHNPDSAAPATKYFCTIRRGHDGANMPKIPGVVRWRWLLKDETIWVRCLQGCCEVNAI